MIDRGLQRRRLLVAALVLLLVLAVAAMLAAGQAGVLPWQPEPTRVPIVPFEGISGQPETPAP